VCEKIQERSNVGKSKYGVTMERTDLSTIEWLTHLQEELMDAAVYVERLLGDLSAALKELNKD
jgi:flagellar motor switch protein FliM